MNKEQEKLTSVFWKKRAVKFREAGFRFNLHNKHPNAPLSPNYMNLRDVFRNREIRRAIAKQMLPKIMELNPDRLVDLPQSVSPLVATLSDLTGIDIISVRSEALKTDKSEKKQIMGKYRKDQRVLIIDDVVSSFAHTKEKAIEVLKSAGLKVIRVVCVVVDREEGGRETLRKKGYSLFCILRLKEMFKVYLERGLITEEAYRNSLKFSRMAKRYALEK